MTRCFICQKNDAGVSGYLCDECDERMKNPPHEHRWRRDISLGELSYYACEGCDDRQGPIHDGGGPLNGRVASALGTERQS